MKKDYSRFAPTAGHLMRPVASQLGFDRLSDGVYGRERAQHWEMIGLQVSQWGGEHFYINFGISIPNLGVPWRTSEQPKDAGLLIYERLYDDAETAGGQMFACESKEALRNSIARIEYLLEIKVAPWLEQFNRIELIVREYFRRWDLQELGKNITQKRLGVLNYAFLLLHQGDTKEAINWFLEAKKLMTCDIDSDDNVLIDKVLKGIN